VAKLVPPYDRHELERVFAEELLTLSELLSPALERLDECQSLFRQQGFVADEVYNALRQRALSTVGKSCLSELAGANADKLSMADLVELYPDRMLQPMPGWPTPRARYRSCLSRAVSRQLKPDLEAALNAQWIAFVNEANLYPDIALPSHTRAAIVESFLKGSASNAGFVVFPVSRSSLKWHPRPTWVDAAIGILRHAKLDLVLVAETSRPRKYELFPDISCEPIELDGMVDNIDLSLWAVPRREITELDFAAIKVRQVLLLYYRDFYSLKGLQRIIDAHVTAARLVLRGPRASEGTTTVWVGPQG
jgi:hypothetical protein